MSQLYRSIHSRYLTSEHGCDAGNMCCDCFVCEIADLEACYLQFVFIALYKSLCLLQRHCNEPTFCNIITVNDRKLVLNKST